MLWSPLSPAALDPMLGEGADIMVSHQHLESSTRRNIMFMLMVSSSSFWDPLEVFFFLMFANILFHLSISSLVCSSSLHENSLHDGFTGVEFCLFHCFLANPNITHTVPGLHFSN